MCAVLCAHEGGAAALQMKGALTVWTHPATLHSYLRLPGRWKPFSHLLDFSQTVVTSFCYYKFVWRLW